jgi:hypothetical protein
MVSSSHQLARRGGDAGFINPHGHPPPWSFDDSVAAHSILAFGVRHYPHSGHWAAIVLLRTLAPSGQTPIDHIGHMANIEINQLADVSSGGLAYTVHG